MKAHYKAGRVTFELEAASAKGLFTAIAAVQEVFDAEHHCGMCQSEEIRFAVREVDDFDFYELHCVACRARFRFGQSKDKVSLFPKRRDDDGKPLPNGGWSRWEPSGARAEETPADPYAETRTGPRIVPETQEVFDKVASMLECAAPVTLMGALNMMREAMTRTLGEKGRGTFAGILTKYERDNPQGIREPAVIKALMTELWRAMKAKAA